MALVFLMCCGILLHFRCIMWVCDLGFRWERERNKREEGKWEKQNRKDWKRWEKQRDQRTPSKNYLQKEDPYHLLSQLVLHEIWRSDSCSVEQVLLLYMDSKEQQNGHTCSYKIIDDPNSIFAMAVNKNSGLYVIFFFWS